MSGAPTLRRDPVAVLAAGVASPIGLDLEAFWAGLLAGQRALSTIERFPVGDLRVGRGGEIKRLPPDAANSRSRPLSLLVTAAVDLTSRARLDAAPERIAVVLGTALGDVEALEDCTAGDDGVRRAADALYDSPAHGLAAWLGARGPALTVSSACASGATALALGADLLHDGHADLVVAGGYDALCRFVMRGFDTLRSLTREEVRPFDRRRTGLLLGEAAGLVLLARGEDARPRPLGRLLGHGSAGDAFHVAAPDPDGRGLESAVRGALAAAGLDAAAVDFVSAHGTATPLNDRIESGVLRRVLGRRAGDVPVNSIKGAIGHTMGAAATLEAIMCLLAARDGILPPTVGYEEADPGCPLDVVAACRRARPRVMLSTSLGFGGCNAALVLEAGPGGAGA
jgi:3-oxoacyl-[acyl-carrier-protein] synthase II